MLHLDYITLRLYSKKLAKQKYYNIIFKFKTLRLYLYRKNLLSTI